VAGLENSITWPELTNGTEYTFTVTAQSAAGSSQASAPSLPARPDERPGTPSAPTVVFGDGELVVSWIAPPNDGSAITGYEVEIGGALSAIEPSSGTRFRWSGLNNGDAYTFRVRAINAAGGGDFSSSSAPEIPAGPPGAASNVRARRANLSGSLLIEWDAPANTNGARITSYRIVPSNGDPIELQSTETSYSWADLTKGVDVSFQVQARTRAGWGPLSSASRPIAPCAVPGIPEVLSVTRGDGRVTINIGDTPARGCSITGYVVSSNLGVQTTSTSRTIVVSNLTNGTPYTFTVAARNEVGLGTASASTSPVTPAGQPRCRGGSSLQATPNGRGAVGLNWTDAIANGDPITGYRITYSGGNRTTSAQTSEQIDKLADNTRYTFSVRAQNSLGESDVCASSTATTWARPTALSATMRTEGSDELVMTIAGGNSPSNPIISRTARCRSHRVLRRGLVGRPTQQDATAVAAMGTSELARLWCPGVRVLRAPQRHRWCAAYRVRVPDAVRDCKRIGPQRGRHNHSVRPGTNLVLLAELLQTSRQQHQWPADRVPGPGSRQKQRWLG